MVRRQEHHQPKFGDFKIVSTSAGKYVEWSVERLRKILASERKFNPKMWATNHEERCPLMLFEEDIAHRPSAMCLADSPFWLAINYNPSNGKFLKSQKMGIKKINGFMKAMVEKYLNQKVKPGLILFHLQAIFVIHTTSLKFFKSALILIFTIIMFVKVLYLSEH